MDIPNSLELTTEIQKAIETHQIEFPEGYSRATIRNAALQHKKHETQEGENDFLATLKKKMMNKFVQPNKRHIVESPSTETTYKKYKKSQNRHPKNKKIMNNGKTTKPTQITDFFPFR